MGESKDDWIDPAAARRLMLEYRQTLGVKGGSEIERQINQHTRLGISRKTLENWLNDPNSVPSTQTIKIVRRFLQTAHFAQVVPRVRDYLEADARLLRIGITLFDLYGVKGEDATISISKNAYLAGWWMASPFFRSYSASPSYLHIEPVPGHPFSKVHVLVHSHEVPTGSGLMFPTTAGHYLDFSVRVWSQGRRYWEKVLKIYCMPHQKAVNEERLKLLFEQTAHPPYPGLNTLNVAFSRVERTDVPAPVQDLFDRWNQSILPRRLSEWGLIS